jgi:hypothetical protein
MTLEELVSEGRRLERPCVFLRPGGIGPIAAVWYERDKREIASTGYRCWLTVDAGLIPGLPSSIRGCLSLFTNEDMCEGGRVEIAPTWPTRVGTPLFAHPASVLPPIDAVFACGSEAVGEWIASHGWERSCRYSNGFKDRALVDQYEQLWAQEYPVFLSDVYAVLGGWHLPGADADWHELIDEQLMILTIRNSEPWVEAWCDKIGRFKVIWRIT